MYLHVRASTGRTVVDSYDNRYRRINNFRGPSYNRDISTFFIKPNLSIAGIEENELPIPTGALRKYVMINISDTGRGIAEYCEATLTLIGHKSTAKRLPSKRKQLAWDTGDIYRTIGKKHGRAAVYIAFSQDSFKIPQNDKAMGMLSEENKTYAKISTPNSLDWFETKTIAFIEDGLSIGDTYFSLFVNTIHGQSFETMLKVHVTNDWHDLSLEQLS